MPGPYTFPIEQIIQRDSSLRKIPSNVETNGRLCLDAIRCCIEAIGLSYARLVAGAVAADAATRTPGGAPPFPIFADSWAMVDWVHRMHDLVKHAPGLRNSSGKQLFLRETASADALRNAFQHPTGEYAKGTPDGSPWGSISWVFILDATHIRRCMTLIGGIQSGALHPVTVPGGHLRRPADLFELTAFGTSASLSKWFDAVVMFARELEERVGEANAALGDAAAGRVTDVMVYLDVTLGP